MKAKRKKLRFKFDKLQAKENPKSESATLSTHLESVSENTQDKQATPNLFNKFMTPKDLEKELGLSIARQYVLRSSKFRDRNAKKGGVNLPFIKQMGLIVYDRDDVIEWLNANKVKE